MKRMLSLLMALAMLVCLLPYGKALAAPEGDGHQGQIDRMNALLNGLTLSEEYTQTAVAQWSDEAVADAIYSKLNWDYQHSDYLYTQQYKAKSEEVCAYDLAGIDKLTRSCYGRDFPRNGKAYGLKVSGDQVILDPSAGENTVLAVQDFYTRGDRVTAVGVAVWFGGAMGKPDGYFQAEFRKNESSIYGYTLISLREIKGNQNFSALTAQASSELKEPTVTHYAQRVVDGNLKTAWVEAVQGVGIGQWIRLSNTSGKKLQLIGIELNLGYQLDQRRLDNNGWPTEILIECEGGYWQKAKAYHYDTVVLLDIPAKTSWVKLTILDAKPGQKYEDTCISEIRLLGLDFEQMIPEEEPEPTQPPATTPKPTQPPATTPKPTQPPATTPKPTQPPATTPKPTQPPATTPRPTQPTKTQPAKPQGTAPQGQSGGNKLASNEGESQTGGNNILMIGIIVVVGIVAIAGIVILIVAKKKTKPTPQGDVSGKLQGSQAQYPRSSVQAPQPHYPQNNPQGSQKYYPWGSLQSQQNPPQNWGNLPQNQQNLPKDCGQSPQQNSPQETPRNPRQQGGNSL